ncbi:low molecular weight protein-tyrosine-phosphatase [Halobacillus sp. A5]|uniref:low molecular weight protein-tyrosine-phosphatase n=1 Tax=Halobacillus sp. A5 TaxID=2880263 RepID=UPI0020A6C6D8|nr:low molecular weight protein-tyrosine-phosphatase [Halobacillus sp. A5]MCP3029072.1 low molecular weight phosphotyrosine protein phosphatase [Halobacillus sp. A5]
MIKVLFVCLGNICRSPMAEAVFRKLVEEEGLEKEIIADSAGIGHWHIGKGPHTGTRSILDENKISYEGMTARQVENLDWDRFDYIIAMDQQNLTDLNAIREKNDVEVQLFMDFVDHENEKDVPDPYFTGNFDYVYGLIQSGCQSLLEHIKQTKIKEEL